jgi:hypothetical protein
MKTTEQLTLTQRLLEFQKQINVIKKDAKNPHFKNTYATLKQVLSEVKPILSEVGLLITQPIDERGIGTVITDGKDSIVSFIPMPNGLQPQQLGSAISYFRRYTICSLLSLEIDDDDANTTNKAIATTPTQKPILKADTEHFGKAVEYLMKGGSIDAIKQKYEVSQEVETKLIKSI